MAGDAILKEVAHRLSQVLRKADTLARLGGDEFVLILNEISSIQDVEALAATLLAAITRPLRWSDIDLHTSASIGISVFPDDGATAEDLLQCRCGDVPREEVRP
jgi:diguanylate cyclase (GGDEF)-like protein